MKGLGCRGLEAEEENMRIITRNELAHYSPRELVALYAWIAEEILYMQYGSPEWHAAMRTLQNILEEQQARQVIVRPKPRGPGF
jgi:hypothetical protein